MSTDTPNDIKIGIKIEVDRKSIEEVQNQLRELAELTDLSTIRSKTKVPDMSKEVKQVTLFAKGAEKAESSINNLQNSIASTTLSPLNQETKIASNLEKDKNVVDELKSAIYSEAVTEQKTSDQVISNTNKEIQINKQLQGEISKVVNLKSQIDTNPKQLRFGDTGELTELSRQTVLFAEESKKADKEVTNLQNTIAKTNVSPLNQDTKIGDSVSVDNGIIKERIRLANEIITLNKQATDIAITNNKAEIESLKSLQTEINNTINAKKELINKEAEKVSQPTNLKGPISVGAITGETKPTNEGNGTTVADAITNLIDHYIQLAEQKKTNDKESEELKNRELERLAQLRKSHIENIEIASKGVKEQAPIDLTQTRVIIEAAKAMHSTEAILKQREGDYKELIVESKNYGNQTEEERKLSDELFKSKYQLNSEQTKLAKTYSIVAFILNIVAKFSCITSNNLHFTFWFLCFDNPSSTLCRYSIRLFVAPNSHN